MNRDIGAFRPFGKQGAWPADSHFGDLFKVGVMRRGWGREGWLVTSSNGRGTYCIVGVKKDRTQKGMTDSMNDDRTWGIVLSDILRVADASPLATVHRLGVFISGLEAELASRHPFIANNCRSELACEELFEAYKHCARAHKRLGNYTAAAVEYHTALRIHETHVGESPRLQYSLACCLIKSENDLMAWRAAADLLHAALSSDDCPKEIVDYGEQYLKFMKAIEPHYKKQQEQSGHLRESPMLLAML